MTWGWKTLIFGRTGHRNTKDHQFDSESTRPLWERKQNVISRILTQKEHTPTPAEDGPPAEDGRPWDAVFFMSAALNTLFGNKMTACVLRLTHTLTEACGRTGEDRRCCWMRPSCMQPGHEEMHLWPVQQSHTIQAKGLHDVASQRIDVHLRNAYDEINLFSHWCTLDRLVHSGPYKEATLQNVSGWQNMAV